MENKKIGSLRIHRGHTLFSVNKVTLEIKRVKSSDGSIVIRGKGQDHKVVIDRDCFYIGALSFKSLKKKLRKIYPDQFEKFKYVSE